MAAGIDGTLRVSITVGKDVSVKNVTIIGGPAWPCVSSPNDELDAVKKAVRENIMGAKFSPAMKNGKPTEADLVADFPIGKAYASALKEREAREGVQAARPRRINGGVINGMALKLVKPEYPSAALGRRLSGAVRVEVVIDASGRVILAGVLDGLPEFRKSAREAACESRFSPTVLSGVAVEVKGIITYAFMP
jgi:TonB family protein